MITMKAKRSLLKTVPWVLFFAPLFAAAMAEPPIPGAPHEPGMKQEPTVADTFYAVKDAKTGKLRKPTAEELKKLPHFDPLNRSSEDLEKHVLKDGSVMVSLEGRFQSVVLAKFGPDGTMVTRCVHSKEEAQKFLQSPVLPRKKVVTYDR